MKLKFKSLCKKSAKMKEHSFIYIQTLSVERALAVSKHVKSREVEEKEEFNKRAREEEPSDEISMQSITQLRKMCKETQLVKNGQSYKAS